MIFHPTSLSDRTLIAATHLHELRLRVLESEYRGDAAFTSAVDFIQQRPMETIAALHSMLDRAPRVTKLIIHWILAYAAARQCHLDAVTDAVDNYLSWHPSRNRLHLKRVSAFDTADVAFRDAVAIKDVDSLWNDLGVLHYSFGYIEEALNFFGQCLARDPSHPWATINFATTLLTQGKLMEAREYVARTAFRPDLPTHVLQIVGAVRASAGRNTEPERKGGLYRYRRCIYSYDWRCRLPELFEVVPEL